MKKHHVVVLEAANCPPVPFSFAHTVHRHDYTQPHEIIPRIQHATIVVVGVAPITPAHLDHAPSLQCLAITATGCEWLDRDAFAARGVTVVNCPQNNVEAVGEHFLALYFAARRKIVEVHGAVTGDGREWLRKGTLTSRWAQGPPLSCRQETLGIIGHGALGRYIEGLARGLGFGRILIAERKGHEGETREGRVSFEELIREATTIAVCCPREPSTLGLISEPELLAMKPEALLVNMSRGGIVCERALAEALKTGRIFGAATDVLETEPGGVGTTPLIPDVANGEAPVPNLTITGHMAWFSQQTIENLVRMLKLGIEGFVNGTLLESSSRGTAIVHGGQVLR